MKSAKSDRCQQFLCSWVLTRRFENWVFRFSICLGYVVCLGYMATAATLLQAQDYGAANVPASGSGSSGSGATGVGARSNPTGLPSSQGQVWREYDLRTYTSMMRDRDKPHQGVIDWVLRETGTDVWFTEPFGFLNADRDTLRVYHTPEMHKVVQGVVDKLIQ